MKAWLILLYIGFCSLLSATQPTVLDGNTILIDDLPTELTGHWQVCQNQRVNLKQNIQNCANLPKDQFLASGSEKEATLQLKVIFDESLKSSDIGLEINDLIGADEVYFNGFRVGKTGNFPPTLEQASFYTRRYFIPQRLVEFNRPNIIQIKIITALSPYNTNSIQITMDTKKALFFQAIADEAFYFIISAALMMICLFKLFYFFRIPGSYETLSLAIFSLTASFTILLSGSFFLQMEFDANSLIRLKTVFFIFSQLAISYFFLNIFELTVTLIRRLVLSIYIVFGIAVLVWPQPEFLETFFFWSKMTAFALPIIFPGLTLVFQRGNFSLLQYYLISVLVIYLILVLLELTRFYWISNDIFYFQNNIMLSIAILLMGIASALATTDKYWQYFKGATYDHLTGTLLKNTFIRRLTEEMQRCRRSELCLLVAVLDLDQFKSLNQNYGHDVGDRALILISATLTKVLRQFDLICRLSDDEFCIAATLPSNENTEAFLSRLHDEINAASLTLENQTQLNLQTTTGAVIYSVERHETAELILHDAQHAVTEAKLKQSGSIQWFDTENPPLQFIF